MNEVRKFHLYASFLQRMIQVLLVLWSHIIIYHWCMLDLYSLKSPVKPSLWYTAALATLLPDDSFASKGVYLSSVAIYEHFHQG